MADRAGTKVELKDLRTFVQVAEFGNISHAAFALGLTQSSVSRIVAGLEEEMGGPLFHRTGRGVTLTETGEAAVGRARTILRDCDRLVADVRDVGASPSGDVSVALLPWMMHRIAGDLYDHIRTRHPRIVLRMIEGFSGRNEEYLADGRADIALIGRYRAAPARGEELLISSHLALVGPGRSESGARTVPFRRLAEIPLVLPSLPHGLRIALNAMARRRHVKLNIVAEADSFEAQKAIVSRQGCCMVLSPQTFQRELSQGAFHSRQIVEPAMPRLVVMMTTTHRPLTRAARAVAAALRMLVKA
jgi:DNA-binding transcriptional LysR family regulator